MRHLLLAALLALPACSPSAPAPCAEGTSTCSPDLDRLLVCRGGALVEREVCVNSFQRLECHQVSRDVAVCELPYRQNI